MPWSAALLCSLCLSKLSPPEEGEPPKGSLGTLGVLCCLHLLWLQPHPLWVNAPSIGSVVHIVILFWLPIGGSLQALHQHLAYIFLSTTASTMAWQPSCMVFIKASICAGLPAQLNGPPKPNSMPLAPW